MRLLSTCTAANAKEELIFRVYVLADLNSHIRLGAPRLTLHQLSSARELTQTDSGCLEGLGVEKDAAVAPVIGGKGRALLSVVEAHACFCP